MIIVGSVWSLDDEEKEKSFTAPVILEKKPDSSVVGANAIGIAAVAAADNEVAEGFAVAVEEEEEASSEEVLDWNSK